MDARIKQKIETEICEIAGKFFKEQLGEQIDVVKAQIIDDAIIVRFKNVLSPSEKEMIESKKEGGAIMKDLKEKLIKKSQPLLESMIKELTKTKVIDIHSSFDVQTGERIEVFVLSESL